MSQLSEEDTSVDDSDRDQNYSPGKDESPGPSLDESQDKSPTVTRGTRALKRTVNNDSRKRAFLDAMEKASQNEGDDVPVPPHKPHPRKPRRNVSDVWKHSTLITRNNINITKCNYCNQFYVYNSSTTNMLSHLKKMHSAIYWPADIDTTTTTTTKTKSNDDDDTKPKPVQRRLSEMYRHNKSPYDRKSDYCMQMDGLLAKFIVKDLVPIDICNSDSLNKCFQYLDPRYSMPSSQTLVNNVCMPMFENTRAVVRNKIQQGASVAVTCDLWSSTVQQSYMTVTCHLINKNYELLSFVLDTFHMPMAHTSENQLTEITRILDEWGLSNKHIFFVSDNVSDISHALRDIGGYDWLGCMGHIINLILQAGLKEESVISLVNHSKKLVQFLKKSNNARSELKKNTAFAGLPDLNVIQMIEVRWNTCSDMLDRLVILYPALQTTMAMRHQQHLITTPSQFVLMNELSKFLKPFKEYTSLLSGQEYPTASLIKAVMEGIRTRLNPSPQDSATLKKVKTLMLTNFEKRHKSAKAKELLSLTSMLDPRFKNKKYNAEVTIHDLVIAKTIQINRELVDDDETQMDSENDIIECTEGQELSDLANSSASTSAGTSALSDLFSSQDDVMFNITSVQSVEKQVCDEFDQYLALNFELNESNRQTFNPIQWWKNNQTKFPFLANSSRHYLNIPATSVPSERVFSTAGNIISKKRSRLSPQTVNMLIFLNKNEKYIPQLTTDFPSQSTHEPSS